MSGIEISRKSGAPATRSKTPITPRRLGLIVFWSILGVVGLVVATLKVLGVLGTSSDDIAAVIIAAYGFGPLYKLVAGFELFVLTFGVGVPAEASSWMHYAGWDIATVALVMFNAIPVAAIAGWATSYYYLQRSKHKS